MSRTEDVSVSVITSVSTTVSVSECECDYKHKYEVKRIQYDVLQKTNIKAEDENWLRVEILYMQ